MHVRHTFCAHEGILQLHLIFHLLFLHSLMSSQKWELRVSSGIFLVSKCGFWPFFSVFSLYLWRRGILEVLTLPFLLLLSCPCSICKSLYFSSLDRWLHRIFSVFVITNKALWTFCLCIWGTCGHISLAYISASGIASPFGMHIFGRWYQTVFLSGYTKL